MKYSRTFFLLMGLVPVFFIVFSGCVRQHETAAAAVVTYESGDLHMPFNKEAPQTVYVDINDSTGHVAISAQQLQDILSKEKFRIVDNPSKAGYILHVSLLQEGQVSPDKLQNLVKSGYGSDARFSGAGASAWLADALLVQRRVPNSSRPSRVRLKNISNRNALDSTQMRVGLMVPETISGRKSYMETFGEKLAETIGDSLLAKKSANAQELPRN